jgi:hypothetical protein
MALLTNIRLSLKFLPGTNALAHYEHLQIADVKSFITLSPGFSKLGKAWSLPNSGATERCFTLG